MGELPDQNASTSSKRTHMQELAAKYVRDLECPSAAEVRALVHALEVHEMELRAQNDQLRATQRDLERSHNRYLELYESAPEGYVTLDADGYIAEANPAAAALMGTARGELIGTPIDRYVAPAGEGAIRDHLARCRGSRGKVVTEATVSTAGAVPPRVQLSTCWIPAQGDGGDCWRMVITDLSRHKEVENALGAAAAELLRSNKDLQQFASIAAHDLQAPLRAVTSFLGLLKDRYAAGLDDKARQFIDFAMAGAVRMNQLISDLLAFARVGSRGGDFRPVELQTVLDRALADRKAAIRQSQAVLTHDALPAVVADESQMVQLLSNLVGNAIKYQAKDHRPEIHVGAERGEGRWVIRVRDNGIGIDPKDADRVFEIFQRLHAQGEYEGTGIGLAICKRIVDRHGGRIWVESQLGQGATFLFTIPDKR